MANRMLIKLLLLSMSLLGFLPGFLPDCDSEECMEDYYNDNKAQLTELRELCESLVNTYDFKVIAILKPDEDVELIFREFNGQEQCGATMYISPNNLSYRKSYDVNSYCNHAGRMGFLTIFRDEDMKKILQIFLDTKPEGIRISSGGVFIALGLPLKTPNLELDGGIHMRFESGYASDWIREIDTNVYLEDSIIY